MKSGGKKPFKFDLQLFAMGGLPIPNDPSQIIVDPVSLGIPPDPVEQQEENPQNEWETRYRDVEGRLNNTQRALHDATSQLSQQNVLIQQMLLSQQAPAQPTQQQQTQPGQGDSWESFMRDSTGQQPQNNGGGQHGPYLTPAEAARIADERIAATLGTIQNQQNVGANLLQDFRVNHPDLHHVSDVVKEIYGLALQQTGPEQAYQYALSRARQMIEQGKLPARQAPQQQNNPWASQPRAQMMGPHGLLPSSPRGGQSNPNQWASPTTAAQNPIRYDDNFVKNELSSMLQERRDLQAKKMAGG